MEIKWNLILVIIAILCQFGETFVIKDNGIESKLKGYKVEELVLPTEKTTRLQVKVDLVPEAKSEDQGQLVVEEIEFPLDPAHHSDSFEDLVKKYDEKHLKKREDNSENLIDVAIPESSFPELGIPDLKTIAMRFSAKEIPLADDSFINTTSNPEGINLDLEPEKNINSPVLKTIEQIQDPDIQEELKAELPNISDDEKTVENTENFVVEDVNANTFEYEPGYEQKVTEVKPEELHQKEQLSVHLVEQIVNFEGMVDSTTIIPNEDLIGDHKNIQNQTVLDVLDHIVVFNISHEAHNVSTIPTIPVDPTEIIPSDRHNKSPQDPYVDDGLKNDKFFGFGNETDLVKAGEETTEIDRFFVSTTETSASEKSLVEEVVEGIVEALQVDLQSDLALASALGEARNLDIKVGVDNSTENVVEFVEEGVLNGGASYLEDNDINENNISRYPPTTASPNLEDKTEIWEVNTQITVNVVYGDTTEQNVPSGNLSPPNEARHLEFNQNNYEIDNNIDKNSTENSSDEIMIAQERAEEQYGPSAVVVEYFGRNLPVEMTTVSEESDFATTTVSSVEEEERVQLTTVPASASGNPENSGEISVEANTVIGDLDLSGSQVSEETEERVNIIETQNISSFVTEIPNAGNTENSNKDSESLEIATESPLQETAGNITEPEIPLEEFPSEINQTTDIPPTTESPINNANSGESDSQESSDVPSLNSNVGSVAENSNESEDLSKEPERNSAESVEKVPPKESIETPSSSSSIGTLAGNSNESEDLSKEPDSNSNESVENVPSKESIEIPSSSSNIGTVNSNESGDISKEPASNSIESVEKIPSPEVEPIAIPEKPQPAEEIINVTPITTIDDDSKEDNSLESGEQDSDSSNESTEKVDEIAPQTTEVPEQTTTEIPVEENIDQRVALVTEVPVQISNVTEIPEENKVEVTAASIQVIAVTPETPTPVIVQKVDSLDQNSNTSSISKESTSVESAENESLSNEKVSVPTTANNSYLPPNTIPVQVSNIDPSALTPPKSNESDDEDDDSKEDEDDSDSESVELKLKRRPVPRKHDHDSNSQEFQKKRGDDNDSESKEFRRKNKHKDEDDDEDSESKEFKKKIIKNKETEKDNDENHSESKEFRRKIFKNKTKNEDDDDDDEDDNDSNENESTIKSRSKKLVVEPVEEYVSTVVKDDQEETSVFPSNSSETKPSITVEEALPESGKLQQNPATSTKELEDIFTNPLQHDVKKKGHVDPKEYENDLTQNLKAEVEVIKTLNPREPDHEQLQDQPRDDIGVFNTIVEGVELAKEVKGAIDYFREPLEEDHPVLETHNDAVSSKNTRQSVEVDHTLTQDQIDGTLHYSSTEHHFKTFWIFAIVTISILLLGVVYFVQDHVRNMFRVRRRVGLMPI